MQGLPEGLSINVADLAEHGQEALTGHAAELEVQFRTPRPTHPSLPLLPHGVLRDMHMHQSLSSPEVARALRRASRRTA